MDQKVIVVECVSNVGQSVVDGDCTQVFVVRNPDGRAVHCCTSVLELNSFCFKYFKPSSEVSKVTD